MRTVKDLCQIQDNALNISVSDQIERLDQLIVTTQAHYEGTVGMKGFPSKSLFRASSAVSPFFLAVER